MLNKYPFLRSYATAATFCEQPDGNRNNISIFGRAQPEETAAYKAKAARNAIGIPATDKSVSRLDLGIQLHDGHAAILAAAQLNFREDGHHCLDSEERPHLASCIYLRVLLQALRSLVYFATGTLLPARFPADIFARSVRAPD